MPTTISSSNRYSLPIIPHDPSLFFSGKRKAHAIKYLMAVGLKLDPQKLKSPPLTGVPREPIFLEPHIATKIIEIGQKNSLSMQEAFAGLCHLGLNEMAASKQQEAKELCGVRARAPFTAKDRSQGVYYENIAKALALKKIVLAEGSTGIGKGRCLMGNAVEQIKAGIKPVFVAAPTLVVLGQLYAEYRQIVSDQPGLAAKVLPLPGKSEFVADDILREFLDRTRDDEHAEVRAWVAAGAPAGWGLDEKKAHYLTDILAHAGIEARWLMDDLKRIATDLPADVFSLMRNKKSAGESSALMAQLTGAARLGEADLVLMTHAKLAWTSKLAQLGDEKWQQTGQPAILMIDEAHLFENAMASANSAQFSPFGLRSHVKRIYPGAKPGTVPHKIDIAMNKLALECRKMSGDGEAIRIGGKSEFASGQQALLALLEETRKYLKSRAIDKDNFLGYAGEVDRLISSLSGRSGDVTVISYSPSMRFPSLSVGPASVRQELGFLWKSAAEGVVLASATLAVPNRYGNADFDYVARTTLAVPESRIVTPNPVTADWLYTTPDVYVLDGKGEAAPLLPPGLDKNRSQDEQEALERDWLSGVAQIIADRIAPTAAGGTLVLCTSYHQINALGGHPEGEAGLIEAAGVHPARILTMRRNERFSAVNSNFERLYRQKVMPIMLALGPAWTGLDMRDSLAATAKDDHLLTDLVIVRCPIGLNRSNAQDERVRRMGTFPIIQEALMTFKQGLGRLIRREGVEHRRIWVLDSRIWKADWSGMVGFAYSAKEILKPYRTVRSI